MGLVNVLGWIGIGYYLKSRELNIPKYSQHSYGKRYNDLPSWGEWAHELAINKLDILFYGGPQHGANRKKTSCLSPISYQKIRNDTYPEMYKLLGVSFQTREDAEKTLDSIRDISNNYGNVRVADFYEIAGVSSTQEDSSWGWTADDIFDFRVRAELSGLMWTIHFPDPIHFD